MAALALSFGALLAATAHAQTYTTARQVYLRASPSKTGAKLRELAEGDTVTRRTELNARPGWLPVRTQDGKPGWVGIVNLRSLAIMVASSGTTVETAPGGAPFTRIDPAWLKPTLDTATIRVQGGALSCSPHGDGADDGTNEHKNRADIPATSHLITVNAIRALPDTALWRFINRKAWTAADSALVIPYEGIPVTVEGYLEIVKPQATNPPAPGKTVGESPNCHSWSEDDTDWHIALVADPSEHEERAVVVEPTPRTKRHHAAWLPDSVARLAVRLAPGSQRNEANAVKVRITGWLMLDPVHPAHIRGKCTQSCDTKTFYRATLWEVHPITRIDVFTNGAWKELP